MTRGMNGLLKLSVLVGFDVVKRVQAPVPIRHHSPRRNTAWREWRYPETCDSKGSGSTETVDEPDSEAKRIHPYALQTHIKRTMDMHSCLANAHQMNGRKAQQMLIQLSQPRRGTHTHTHTYMYSSDADLDVRAN